MAQLIDAATGEVLLPAVEAVGAFSRRSARGLLGREALAPGAGLLLADPLRCIHTIGMRFAIDVVFLDRSLRIVRVASRVPAGRLRWHRHGRFQLEVAAGAAADRGLLPGRQLRLRPAGGHDRGESPRAACAPGEPAHSGSAGRCAAAGDLPRLPVPAGTAGADRPPTERSTPCAHTC